MNSKILVATEKPFAGVAVKQIREICEDNGHILVLLEKYEEQAELIQAVSAAEALIVRSDKITEDVISHAAKLQIIVRAGAGYDNIDLNAASQKGIIVMNTPGQNSNAVAELALGMMIYMARGKFNGKSGTELKDKKLGIHAYGYVGKNVARIAHGFGMEVMAYDPFVTSEIMINDGVQPAESAEALYKNCDYVSLHLPSIPETQKFVDYELLMKMKKGSTLVNTARKEVVCEDSIMKALSEREDLKYVSDIAPDNAEELMSKFPDRCYFTPKKMGAQTKEANINAGVAAIRQIVAYFKTGDTTFQVNK
ncbi:MAG: 3-phosphoglycerate dehydrogenase [Candidatus Cloacimonetes bacterium]|nr:3-phosphoglycerate dehydrogenase [Candidatus Cloacimonadota bacterium]